MSVAETQAPYVFSQSARRCARKRHASGEHIKRTCMARARISILENEWNESGNGLLPAQAPRIESRDNASKQGYEDLAPEKGFARRSVDVLSITSSCSIAIGLCHKSLHSTHQKSKSHDNSVIQCSIEILSGGKHQLSASNVAML